MSTGKAENEGRHLEMATTAASPVVAIQDPAETGLEELEPGDFVVPVVSIVQEKSTIAGRAPLVEEIGKLYNPVTACVADSILVIPMVFVKTRLMMPLEFEPGNKPTCGSLDFKVPSKVFENTGDSEYPEIQRGPCSTCQFSRWGIKKSGTPKPPQCWEVWNFLFVSEDLFPFWMRYKVTALAGARKYVSALTILMKINKAPMWHYTSGLTIAKGAKAWEPKFSRPYLIDDPEKRAEKDEIRAALAALRPPHRSDEEEASEFVAEQGDVEEYLSPPPVQTKEDVPF